MNTKMNTSSGTTAQTITRRLLASGDDTDGRFAVVALTLPPYHEGQAMHTHPAHVEGCYVVSGTLAITRDDRTITLVAGAGASTAAGSPHSIWNPTASATTVLLVYTPGVPAPLADSMAAAAPTLPLE